MVLQMIAAGVSAARAGRPVDGAESRMARRHEIAESVITGRKPEVDMAQPHQPAAVWRIVADHPEPDLIVTREHARGSTYACLQEARPKGRVGAAQVEDEDACSWRRVAGSPSDGERSGDWRPQPR